jgi:hypothetical protein
MKTAKSFLVIIPNVFCLYAFMGCGITGRRIHETELQELATKHRDVWLMTIHSQDHEPLSQSSIKSIKKGADGWHVTFLTETGGGPGEEHGLHVYYLHVYLNEDGTLQKVVRGPDVLS